MIRVGIGGWNYDPWWETFYPADLPKAKDLEYASSKVTAIEINATFYRTQSAASFKKWAAATPGPATSVPPTRTIPVAEVNG